MIAAPELRAGEVGFLITGIKDVTRLRVGDTLTTKHHGATEPLPGYREIKPMVFCGLFPIETDAYPELRDALEKLTLNDAALTWEPETSDALGFGFRCGFLGLLHMDIVRERLQREYDLELLATMPSVGYEVTLTNGEELEVHAPSDMPEPVRIEEIREPFIKASIVTPKEYIGQVMELCQERRGDHAGMHFLSAERVQLTYDLPLAEIVLDFFDQLKSRTRGYASLDYDVIGMRPGDLVKLDVLLAGDVVDALSMLVHRDKAYALGRMLVEKLRAKIPRQQYDVPIQAAVGAQHHRPRDGQGLPQGRHRQVLRRRHLAQAQAAREAEGGQAPHEAGRAHRGAPGGLPGRPGARRLAGLGDGGAAARGPVGELRVDRDLEVALQRARDRAAVRGALGGLREAVGVDARDDAPHREVRARAPSGRRPSTA